MLHINDLSLRIEGRPILDSATAVIPTGHRAGLVGRNGAGKTTLLRIVAGELAPDLGSVTVPRGAAIGYMTQEAPGGQQSLIEWVLAADLERSRLLDEAQHATDPGHPRIVPQGRHLPVKFPGRKAVAVEFRIARPRVAVHRAQLGHRKVAGNIVQ